MSDPAKVQIPGKAVDDGTDVGAPATALLQGLNLLPTKDELDRADGTGAVFTGPPQSVALIEAGATAASKWWATGLGTFVVATWGSVAAWWPDQDVPVQVAVLGSAALVTAALVAAIGYLIASDVRGRAAATVAVVEARSRVAITMVHAAREAYEPTPASSAVDVIPLPAGVRARYTERPTGDEDGWTVLALERGSEGQIEYLIVKGPMEAKVPATKLEFDAQSGSSGTPRSRRIRRVN